MHVLDRATAAETASHPLPCITGNSDASSQAPALMSVLDDGPLVVACTGVGATGGIFGLDAKLTLQGGWPLPHGNNRGHQRGL